MTRQEALAILEGAVPATSDQQRAANAAYYGAHGFAAQDRATKEATQPPVSPPFQPPFLSMILPVGNTTNQSVYMGNLYFAELNYNFAVAYSVNMPNQATWIEYAQAYAIWRSKFISDNSFVDNPPPAPVYESIPDFNSFMLNPRLIAAPAFLISTFDFVGAVAAKKAAIVVSPASGGQDVPALGDELHQGAKATGQPT